MTRQAEDTETEVEVTGADVMTLIHRGEIDAQVATAKRYPRSIKRFSDRVLEMATLNEDTAGECFYALPRAGKIIEGPSARFAEIVISAYGNSQAGARVIEEGEEYVKAQGVFHDMENNVRITYEVRRRIADKKGIRFSADMIGVTANAACAIALRNAVLKGVPKAFWSGAYEAARKAAVGDQKTLATRRADLLAYLAKQGVDAKRIFTFFGVNGVEDITLDHLIIMHGTAKAIKDGEITPDAAFTTNVEEKTASATDALRDRLAAEKAKPAAADPMANATPVNGEMVDMETGEVLGKAPAPEVATPAPAAQPVEPKTPAEEIFSAFVAQGFDMGAVDRVAALRYIEGRGQAWISTAHEVTVKSPNKARMVKLHDLLVKECPAQEQSVDI